MWGNLKLKCIHVSAEMLLVSTNLYVAVNKCKFHCSTLSFEINEFRNALLLGVLHWMIDLFYFKLWCIYHY